MNGSGEVVHIARVDSSHGNATIFRAIYVEFVSQPLNLTRGGGDIASLVLMKISKQLEEATSTTTIALSNSLLL